MNLGKAFRPDGSSSKVASQQARESTSLLTVADLQRGRDADSGSWPIRSARPQSGAESTGAIGAARRPRRKQNSSST